MKENDCREQFSDNQQRFSNRLITEGLIPHELTSNRVLCVFKRSKATSKTKNMSAVLFAPHVNDKEPNASPSASDGALPHKANNPSAATEKPIFKHFYRILYPREWQRDDEF